jgi:intein/homing endonuclease
VTGSRISLATSQTRVRRLIDDLKETNRQKVMKVMENGELKETYSSEVTVGDFLYIPED